MLHTVLPFRSSFKIIRSSPQITSSQNNHSSATFVIYRSLRTIFKHYSLSNQRIRLTEGKLVDLPHRMAPLRTVLQFSIFLHCSNYSILNPVLFLSMPKVIVRVSPFSCRHLLFRRSERLVGMGLNRLSYEIGTHEH